MSQVVSRSGLTGRGGGDLDIFDESSMLAKDSAEARGARGEGEVGVAGGFGKNDVSGSLNNEREAGSRAVN